MKNLYKYIGNSNNSKYNTMKKNKKKWQVLIKLLQNIHRNWQLGIYGSNSILYNKGIHTAKYKLK